MCSSMRTLRARGASAREWRLCAVPWGEGSAGVGVGARGSCQGGGRRGEATGDGDAPRRAPLDSCLRRNDARGGGCFGIRFVAGLVQISYKSKNFFAECKQPPGVRRRSACGRRCGPCGRGALRRESGGCVLFHGGRVARGLGLALGVRVRVAGGVGKRRETETPRAAPLWVPAFAGMTRAGVRGNDGGCVRGDALARGVGVRWGPPSCALRTSFDRLRANGLVEHLRRGGGVLGGIRVYEGVRAVELSRRGRGAGLLVSGALARGRCRIVVALGRNFGVANGLTEVQYFAVI